MTTSKSPKTTDKATDQLMIRGKLVTVKLCKLKQADLSFSSTILGSILSFTTVASTLPRKRSRNS
jgi:hypothetical protein